MAVHALSSTKSHSFHPSSHHRGMRTCRWKDANFGFSRASQLERRLLLNKFRQTSARKQQHDCGKEKSGRRPPATGIVAAARWQVYPSAVIGGQSGRQVGSVAGLHTGAPHYCNYRGKQAGNIKSGREDVKKCGVWCDGAGQRYRGTTGVRGR